MQLFFARNLSKHHTVWTNRKKQIYIKSVKIKPELNGLRIESTFYYDQREHFREKCDYSSDVFKLWPYPNSQLFVPHTEIDLPL